MVPLKRHPLIVLKIVLSNLKPKTLSKSYLQIIFFICFDYFLKIIKMIKMGMTNTLARNNYWLIKEAFDLHIAWYIFAL
jgi:hypothetical protein